MLNEDNEDDLSVQNSNDKIHNNFSAEKVKYVRIVIYRKMGLGIITFAVMRNARDIRRFLI